jgi:hypothetical protein
VQPERITTNPEKLKAVRESPTPKNKHKIRSFLGLCTYYRRFIFGFANIAKPPTKLTEETQTFQWAPEVEAAFQTNNNTARILAYPQPKERYIVDADASIVGTEGVLSQVQHGQKRLIAFYSKTPNEAERNYCVSRRELLAIVRTLVHCHKYFYGQEFHLLPDRFALTWLTSFKNLKGQTARWVQRL